MPRLSDLGAVGRVLAQSHKLPSLSPHDNRCSVPLPPGETTRPRVEDALGNNKGGIVPGSSLFHSKPTASFGTTWPWPNTEVQVLQRVVNSSRSKSNKQQIQLIASPGHSSPWPSLELLPSLSSTAWQPQTLCIATSSPGTLNSAPNHLQWPHPPGLMVPSLCPEEPWGGQANISACQPLISLLLPHPLWWTECLCAPRFTHWNPTLSVMVLEVGPLGRLGLDEITGVEPQWRGLVPLEESRKRCFPLLSPLWESTVRTWSCTRQETGPRPVTGSAGTLTSDFLASRTEEWMSDFCYSSLSPTTSVALLF